MKIRITLSMLCLVMAVSLTMSCVKDLDFDQLDDVRLTPVYELDFVYTTFDAAENVPEGIPPNTEFEIASPLQDTINYDLISSDFAIDNLERVEVLIEVSNQIERGFELQFQFLTEGGQPIGELYRVPVAPGNGPDEPGVISYSVPDPIVLDKPTLQSLQNARKVAAELIIPTLNSDLRGVLELKSKAAYYINYAL